MNSPKITYDAEANALYVQFSDQEIAETLELSESVYVDVDAEGVPVGLEVLDASADVFAGIPAIPDSAALKDLMRPRAA
jgi:uncharacterized protein YuzE